MSGKPSSTLASWPEVSTRSTPSPISVSSARNGSAATSNARWNVTERGRASAINSRVRVGVDFARRRQQADDDAVRAFGLGGFDVGPHGRELIVIEQEVSAARPDHHIEVDAGDLPRLTDHAAAWRDAALQQIGAELDALSPGSLRGADAGDRIHTYLVDHGRSSDPDLPR